MGDHLLALVPRPSAYTHCRIASRLFSFKKRKKNSLKNSKIFYIILQSPYRTRAQGKKGFQPERLWMTLEEIKQLVARRRYQYSRKVRDFIEDGFFDEEDLVHCILSATRIHKSERDELGQAIHGMKYVILGRDIHGRLFYTVGKGIQAPGGRLYFYITAHQADADR
jgi:hypothetical protein